jgi:uncharacterized protein YjbI with pentapeptide repeats
MATKANKQQLIERWTTPEGQRQHAEILNALAKQKSLDRLSFVEQVEGRYDLRGITFEYKTSLKKMKWENIDFSYANFNHMLLLDSVVENVIFDGIDGTEFCIYSSTFRNCRFTKANLNYSGFGAHGGLYENVIFDQATFKQARFDCPVFSHCAFLNCKLGGVDFDASHFVHVRFTGKVTNVWFRGQSAYESDLAKHKKAGHGLNPMIVDFSDAELWGVTISHYCDLSRVILPTDGNHYLFTNWYNVLMELDKRIDQEFSDPTWRSAAHDFVWVYKGHAKKQAMEILNVKNIEKNERKDLQEQSEAYSKRFIALLQQIERELAH